MLITMLAALVAAPQDPPTTGFLMELPISILEEVNGAGLEMTDADGTTVPLSTYDPTLTISQLPVPAGMAINSFSRGTGAMYSDWDRGNVYPVIGLDGWSFMVFSVSGSGWDSSTPYAEEPIGGGLEGDVFSYIIEGSAGYFPIDEVGTLHKVRDGNQLGVGRLAGIDTYFPGYALGEDYVTEFEEEEGAPRRPLYFTLVSYSGNYSSIPDLWVGGDATLKQPSTIFVVTLDGGVGSPTVYRTAADIGLDPGDIIDALTVMDPQWDLAPGDTDARGMDVLVGIDTDDWDKKLHVHGTWTDDSDPLLPVEVDYSGPLMDSSGGLFVKTQLGFNNPLQRVRASCGDDPGDDGSPINPRFELRRERTGVVDGDAIGNFPGSLDYSMHQVRRPPGTATAHFRATLRGFAGQSDVFARLYCWDSGFEEPVTPGTMIGYVLRNRNDAAGDKQFLKFKIPSIGTPVDWRFQWIVYGVSGTLGESRPFVIRVR